ncbi:MAG: CHAT domain-containing protein [Elainella sp. C42_A2020_010]|nr:CHAT domain-containing protein [Elainella sp. C42_A2020_010]
MGNRRLSQRRKWLKRILAVLLGIILFFEAGAVLAQDDRSVGNEAIVAQSDNDIFTNAERLWQEGYRLYKQGAAFFPEAIQKLQESLELFQSISSWEGQILALSTLGSIYRDIGEYEKALNFLDQGLLIFKDKDSEDTDVYKAIILVAIGEIHRRTGNIDGLINIYSQAIPLLQQIGDRESIAYIYLYIGDAHLSRGNYSGAINEWNSALRLFAELDFKKDQANALNRLGYVFLILDKQQALHSFQRALELLKQDPFPPLEATVWYNQGLLFADPNFVARVVAVSNNEEVDPRGIALHFFRKARNIASQEDCRRIDEETCTVIQVMSLVRITDIRPFNFQEEEPREIINEYEQLLGTSRRLGLKTIEAEILSSLAKTYSAMGDRQRAIELYTASKQLFQDNSYEFEAAIVQANLATEYSKQNDLSTALNEVNSAINSIESFRLQIGNDDLRTSFFTDVQEIYDFKISLLMQLHHQHPAQDYEVQAFQTSEQTRGRVLTELLQKSNINLQPTSNNSAVQDLLKEKSELESQLEFFLQQSRFVDDYDLKTGYELFQKISEVRRDLVGIQEQLDQSFSYIDSTSPLNFSEIQQDVLDDDTVLLQYAIGEQQSYLWVVPHQGEMTTFTLPGRKVIEPAAKKFLSEVERSGIRPGSEPEEVKFTGDQLYSLIFQDAKTQQSIMTQLQGKKRILIAADGILHTIPFAALPLPTTERYTPLITQYEIVNTPSASTIAILRQQFNDRKPAPKTIALLADPVFRADETRVTQQPATAEDICELTINSASPSDSAYGQANPNLPIELASTLRSFNLANIDRLPCTQLEAESILSLVPDADQKAAVFGFDANYDWMTQASSQLDQYRIVHLATHGFADEKNPELSMLVLSLVDPQGNTQNGMLRLRDIFNLKLNADMVVLSACQTGQGENVRGEGLIGITRGFMYAGAKRVVNSLWYVNDAKTAELMVRFYKGILQENLSPTAALQKAQIQMWETYKKPELWAAFTIQGEWRIQN